jgi:hypothetical protein
MNISIKFEKSGSTAAILAVDEGDRVFVSMQKWAPSGRRLVHRAFKDTEDMAGRCVEHWKANFERLGWSITSEKTVDAETTWEAS